MPTTVQRIFNFSAGPAVLPQPVLEEAQRDLVSLPGVGMSILEISHRSKTFEDILAKTEADLRSLGNIPETHTVLFLQGGASLQFSMVPMNLLTTGSTADYIITGAWAQKALKEAQRVGAVHIAASTEGENFNRVPRQEELRLTHILHRVLADMHPVEAMELLLKQLGKHKTNVEFLTSVTLG